MEWFRILIAHCVAGILKSNIAAHQRAIGSKAVRDDLCITCRHDDWDVVMSFCRSCGTTKIELMEHNERLN